MSQLRGTQTPGNGNDNAMSFLCCGPGLADQASELSEMFTATQRKVVATSHATYEAIANGKPGQQQQQDWSNPFDYMRQERHSHEEISRWAQPPDDDRIPSSARSPDRRSAAGKREPADNRTPGRRSSVGKRDQADNRGHHTHRGDRNDAHDDRDTLSVGDEPDHQEGNRRVRRVRHTHNVTQTYNNRALALQEQIISTTTISREEDDVDGDFSRKIMKKPLKGRKLENQNLKDKHLMLNRKLNERALASKEAADRSKALRQQVLLVKHTESTRTVKNLSPVDVRDPETVAGMKCQVDVELEEVARKQAVSMLNDDQFTFNEKAGIAAFSAREIAFNHRKSTTTLGPMV